MYTNKMLAFICLLMTIGFGVLMIKMLIETEVILALLSAVGMFSQMANTIKYYEASK